MSRIPAAASVTLAGLLPVCAAALGLGEIESKSYLNQPLSAEIPVFSEVPSEIAGLNVSLASQDTFSQYGLQRPAFLGDLAFTVVPGPRGAVIRINSAQPVGEPFVTMLLEVRWPQGRLLREYTVLLDPPAFAAGAVRQPVQAPTAPARPMTAVETESAPAAAIPAAMASPGDSDGVHTVVRNETLWGIADRYRPDSAANINQVMLAIYRANPEAFAGNINRLRAGAVLRLPDRTAIEGMSRGEADSEVRRQDLEWRGASAGTTEGPARLELVPPSETTPAAPAVSPAKITQLESQAEESRRLLALKDQELQALRNRITQLEKQGGEVAVEEPPATGKPAVPAPAPAQPEAAATEEPAPSAPSEAEPTEKTAPAKPVRARPAEAPKSGILGAIGSLLTSIWFWIPALIVVIGGWLIARRRGAGDDRAAWRPPTTRGDRDDDAGQAVVRRRPADEMIVIEEPGRAQATGGFERRATPRGDEETLLERTISTDGPVNLDQSDPLAEADFHMAYGLYDQAADLLTAAMAREPARRDLHLKLLDVYFVWENREAFLKEARALRERVGTDADPDWKRVIIMGKQLCPTEVMFAGAAAPAAEEMDLALTADGGGTVDLSFGDAGGGLDFDLSGDLGADVDSSASTKVARPWSSAQTQEIPTMEAPGMDLSTTMETPTIESRGISSTLETPTIEAPMGERTLETPTVETTARFRGGVGDERSEQTEEIDLEDLGLDLTGLDEAARDMSTGLQEALPDDGGGLDFDMTSSATSSEGEESTAELEKSPTMKNRAGKMTQDGGDTAEQLSVGESMITPGLSATSGELEALNVDLDVESSEPSPTDLTATGLRALRARGPDDATMTEVGTKLDLARAYLDMGDPDGARSILNEVLEEGDPPQRQEARQLLDGLDG